MHTNVTAEAPRAPGDHAAARALRESIDRFCARTIDAARIDRDGGIPAPVLAGLGELGVFGATIPEEYGGSGLDLAGAVPIVEALARHDRSVATTVGLHLGLGTRPLVDFGTPAQKAAYLPRLASGERLAAFATTEPSAGSDLSAIATTLRPRGDGFVLDGQKAFVTNGGIAGLITVAAKGAQRETSLVLVEGRDPGLTRLAEEKKLGLRGSSTTGLVFEDLQLPADRVLGKIGDGQEQLGRALGWGRVLMAAGCLGTAGAAHERALRYTEERMQFGRRLSDQPVVRQFLEDMRVRVAVMRALVDDAAISAGAEFARLSACAKVFCSEGAWRTCDTALQLFGGSGYIEDTGMALMLRDARVTRIFEGANEVLLTHLGLIELTTRQEISRRPSADDTERLDRAVATFAKGLQRTKGLRAIHDKLALYRLGSAVVLRDAARASASTDAAASFAAAALREATAILESP